MGMQLFVHAMAPLMFWRTTTVANRQPQRMGYRYLQIHCDDAVSSTIIIVLPFNSTI